MKLLDLFCCEGGAGFGYAQAGFEVTGVDDVPQPDYPFRFILRDAFRFALAHGHEFDVIHASPPCQHYSSITADKDDWPDLIAPTRAILKQIGKPYVIENVAGARDHLLDPILLCGSSFALGVRRHRYFESNVPLLAVSCDHESQGRPIGVYGHHSAKVEHLRPNGTKRGMRAASVDEARVAMGMPWATWRGLVEAVPPAYTEYIGTQLMEALT